MDVKANVSTRISAYSSLQELLEELNSVINRHKALIDGYGQQLGEILRRSEESEGNAEWFKEFSKLSKGGKSEKDKGGKTGKGSFNSTDWVKFHDLMLFGGNTSKGEVQIYFDAVKELRERFETLERAKKALEMLGNSGVGSVRYTAYFHDDVLEKIVLRKQENGKVSKFSFEKKLILKSR